MTRLRPWRLAGQIYGLSLLTLLVVVLALFALLWAVRAPRGLYMVMDHIVQEIAVHSHDTAAMQAAADRFASRMHDEVAVFTPDGARVVASRGSRLEALPREQAAALLRGEPVTPAEGIAVAMRGPAFVGYAVVGLHPPPPGGAALAGFALVLAILAGASVLVARRLVGPLGRLVATARAFGAGDMRVRVDLPPRGALGALGAVFDEMAGRVARLLQAQRELLTNVSHELRTPLSRLRVALELAAESDGPGARAELRAAEDDLAQLERMVEDVLRVASLDLATLQPAGAHVMVRRERIDLAALAERTTRRFAAACSDREVEVSAPEGPLWAEADAELLRRALDNLLENARKYSGAGARIDVSVVTEGELAVVTVADQGVGIDPADQPHVFTPFFRADRSRARVSGGVGLGLTLVQRIAAAHGGEVTLESSPGQGTRVALRVPRA